MNKLRIKALLLLLKRDDDPTKRKNLIARLEEQRTGPEIVEIPRGGMSDEQLRDLGFEVPEEK